MLHARLHGRQARAMLLAVVLATGAALLDASRDRRRGRFDGLGREPRAQRPARGGGQELRAAGQAAVPRLGYAADAARCARIPGGRPDSRRRADARQGRRASQRRRRDPAGADPGRTCACERQWRRGAGSAGRHPEAVARPARDGTAAARGTGGLPVRSHARRHPRARAARQAPRRDGRAGRELPAAARCAAAQWRHRRRAARRDRQRSRLDRAGTTSRSSRSRRHGGTESRSGLEHEAPESSGHVAAAAGSVRYSGLRRARRRRR